MQASVEQAAENAALSMEPGAVRIVMARAFQEIEDPGELSARVAELAQAAARLTEANAEGIKARRDEGS